MKEYTHTHTHGYSLLKLINSNRAILMGIAILWIVTFHSQYRFSTDLFKWIRKIGYGGVDIFFLLSGIGMYYSLNKSKEDILSFYKRRITRIIPAYIPILFIWFIIKINNSDIQIFNIIKQFIGNISMTGWWINLPNQFNWYVQMIMWLYFISPILYKIINILKTKFQAIIMIILSIVFAIPFFNSTILMAVSRIPIFLIGMLVVHYSMNGENDDINAISKKKSIIISVILSIVMILGFVVLIYWINIYDNKQLRGYGTYWWPFIMITPGLTIILSFLFNLIRKVKFCKYVIKFIEIIGTSSFEIYLIHILLFDMLKKYMQQPNVNIKWIGIIVISIFISIAYHFLIDYIIKKITNVAVKNKKVQA